MERICRICLRDDANIPIFDNNAGENNVNKKLSLCVKEKVEDIEGYPRNICAACNSTLDSICVFIEKYKQSYKVLESGLLLVKEEQVYSDNDLSEVEIDLVELKTEKDLVLEDTSIVEPLKLKIEKLKNVSIKRVPKKNVLKSETTSIAESILEGGFKWDGESVKPKVEIPSQLKEKDIVIKKKTLLMKKQKELKKRRIKKKEVIPRPTTKPDNAPKPPKLCDLCGEIFTTSDQLGYHKQKKHKDHPVKCPTCDRTCSSEYYLKRHIKRKHTDKKDFVCAICGRCFAFKGELSSHYKSVHVKKTGPPKMFSCKICGKTYKCRKSVVVHERAIHTGERPAVCTICNTSFTHEDYLRDHMRLHTGETPFKCPICGRGYAQRCNMKSHLRIHRVSELDAAALSKLRPNYLRRLKV
ncbi:uncharacterized protein isoform X2 [Choristoneura fumiferana]|uniref:uncharacterized protein isoform X2 n=1 Tax=Choristoneura fumiferana TaxID=7141 RepID=UPI003D156A4D